MEKIRSLKRKIVHNSGSDLSKLKIKIEKFNLDKTLEKIAYHYAKELSEDMLSGEPNYLEFSNIKLSVLDSNYDNKLKSYATDDKEHNAYEIALYNGEKYNLIYTVPTVDIPKKNRKYKFNYPDNNSKSSILDMRYIYGVLKMVQEVYNFIKNNEYILDEEFREVSYFNDSYTKQNFEDILKLPYESGMTLYMTRYCKIKCEDFRQVQKLIIDTIILMQLIDKNNVLANKYNNDSNSECARAFETKKNIPENVQNVMNNNLFLSDFKYVEIDSETDLNKFKMIEKEWVRIRKSLNLSENFKRNAPELRFKKLGKHKSLGLYYSSLNCLCVDINSTSSFMHELGHYIDYTNKEGQLSMMYDFIPVANMYKEKYNDYLEKFKDADNSVKDYLKRKVNYFFTPTEIFARCFEIYLINKGYNTSFLKEKEDLSISGGYPEVDNDFLEVINNYYDNVVIIDKIKEEEIKQVVEENKNININIINYIKPIESITGQYCFAI